MARDWCGLNWTDWQPLDRDAVRSVAPALPGVYRVRRTGDAERFVYIGQTGRTLHERLLSLAREVNGETCPYNDPHTAAPHLWLIRTCQGARFEFSCAPVAGDTTIRRGTEDMLLWRHRVEFGLSTEANYGRFFAGYIRPTNRVINRARARVPGRAATPYAEGEAQPCYGPSEPVISGAGRVLDAEWWQKAPLTTAPSLPEQCAIYCIFEDGADDPAYIGETSSLRARSLAHLKAKHELREPQLAYRLLPVGIPKHVLRELESDLMGWHFWTTRSGPRLQYRVEPQGWQAPADR